MYSQMGLLFEIFCEDSKILLLMRFQSPVLTGCLNYEVKQWDLQASEQLMSTSANQELLCLYKKSVSFKKSGNGLLHPTHSEVPEDQVSRASA